MGARYLTWIDGEEATIELLEQVEGTIRARIEPAEGERMLRRLASVEGRKARIPFVAQLDQLGVVQYLVRAVLHRVFSHLRLCVVVKATPVIAREIVPATLHRNKRCRPGLSLERQMRRESRL